MSSKAIEVTVNVEQCDLGYYEDANVLEAQITFRTKIDKLIFASHSVSFPLVDGKVAKTKNVIVMPHSTKNENCENFKSNLFRDTYVYLTLRLCRKEENQGFRTVLSEDYLIFSKQEPELIRTQNNTYPYFLCQLRVAARIVEKQYKLFSKQVALRAPSYLFTGMYAVLSSDGNSGQTYYFSSIMNSGFCVLFPQQMYFFKQKSSEKLKLTFYGVCEELPNHQFLLYSMNLSDKTECTCFLKAYTIKERFHQLLSFYIDNFDLLRNNASDS